LDTKHRLVEKKKYVSEAGKVSIFRWNEKSGDYWI